MASEVTGDSPQAVAFRLTEVIATLEGKSLYDSSKGATRQYTLALYKECISAVLDIQRWGPYSS